MLDAGTVVVSVQLSADRLVGPRHRARDSPVSIRDAGTMSPMFASRWRAWMSLFGRRAGASVADRGAIGSFSATSDRPRRSVTICLRSRLAGAGRAAQFSIRCCWLHRGRAAFVVVADDELNSLPFGAMPIDGVAAIDRFRGPLRSVARDVRPRSIGSAGHGAWAKGPAVFRLSTTSPPSKPVSGRRSRHAVARRFRSGRCSNTPPGIRCPSRRKRPRRSPGNFAPVRTTVISRIGSDQGQAL